MSPPREGQPSAAVVQIFCSGTLSASETAEFDGWDVRITGGTTILSARGADQAALHGVLDRLARSGVHVVEVRRQPGQEAG